jgi:HEAT repeat protein
MSHKDWLVREKVVYMWGKGKSAIAMELLIKALKDDNRTVCRTAAIGLGNIRNRKATEFLREALEDEEEFVIKAVRESLEKIENKK